MASEGRHVADGRDADKPAPEGTMRAIVQERYGSADVLHMARIERPVIAANEVLVRVHAAGLDLVRSLGADHVIDYTREDFAKAAARYDLILDIGGSPSLLRLRRALTPAGTAVLVGGENGGNWTGMSRQLRAVALSPFVRQRLTMFIAKQRAGDLEEPAGLIDAGSLMPGIDRTFPLDQMPEAMRYLDAGKVRGKVAIII